MLTSRFSAGGSHAVLLPWALAPKLWGWLSDGLSGGNTPAAHCFHLLLGFYVEALIHPVIFLLLTCSLTTFSLENTFRMISIFLKYGEIFLKDQDMIYLVMCSMGM